MTRPEDGKRGGQHEPQAETSVGEKPRPADDKDRTMQEDHDGATGRQSYSDARGNQYSRDFQEDGSGDHPLKEASDDELDENGIPKIAETAPHQGSRK